MSDGAARILTRQSRATPTALAVLTMVAWALVAVFVGRWSVTHAIDLRVYRAAGGSMLHGGGAYVRSFTARGLPFTYPPFALFIFAPLTVGSVTSVVWTWSAAGLLALSGALTLVVRRSFECSWPRAILCASALAGLASLALEPVRSTFLDGQINLFLVAAVVVDILAVRSPFRGVLVGLCAAVKLTPLVFIVYFIATGDRRAAVRSVLTFAVVTGVAWLVLPADSTTFWLHQAFSPGRRGGSRSSFNQSWWGLVGRLPPGAVLVRTALWLVLCAATLVVAVLVARRLAATARTLEEMLVIALAGLLVSPISWTHHWAWVALVPVLLAARSDRVRGVSVALAVLVAVAVLAPYGWHVRGPGTVVASFSLTLAGAAVLVAYGLDELARHRRASRVPGAELPDGQPNVSPQASSAATTSSTKSPVDSMPTAMRTSPGDTPSRADAS